MAGKSKNMSQIKQLLLLKKSGISNRKAANIIGMNKETVNNYMNKVNADSLSLDELIRLDDPFLSTASRAVILHIATSVLKHSKPFFHIFRKR